MGTCLVATLSSTVRLSHSTDMFNVPYSLKAEDMSHFKYFNVIDGEAPRTLVKHTSGYVYESVSREY
jgi:hypothetical protein